MNITSLSTKIFAKEFDGKIHYRAGMSRKNQNNEYEKAYIDVKLPKDVSIQDRTKINITKGFLSFYNYLDKEGKTKTTWYVVVQEFTIAVQKQEEKKEDPYEIFGTQITVEDLDKNMDLPF